jgi:hypothetical protein
MDVALLNPYMVLGYLSGLYFGPVVFIILVTAAIVSEVAKRRMPEAKKRWINAIALQCGVIIFSVAGMVVTRKIEGISIPLLLLSGVVLLYYKPGTMSVIYLITLQLCYLFIARSHYNTHTTETAAKLFELLTLVSVAIVYCVSSAYIGFRKLPDGSTPHSE